MKIPKARPFLNLNYGLFRNIPKMIGRQIRSSLTPVNAIPRSRLNCVLVEYVALNVALYSALKVALLPTQKKWAAAVFVHL